MSQFLEGRESTSPVHPQTYTAVNSGPSFTSYQEDAHTVTAVHIPPAELRHSLIRYFGLNWDPGHIGETLAGQVLFAGIYDGCVRPKDASRMTRVI